MRRITQDKKVISLSVRQTLVIAFPISLELGGMLNVSHVSLFTMSEIPHWSITTKKISIAFGLKKEFRQHAH